MKTVLLPHRGFEPVKWAEEHCPSYITYVSKTITTEVPVTIFGKNATMIKDKFYVEYQFSDEADAMLFALRWL